MTDKTDKATELPDHLNFRVLRGVLKISGGRTVQGTGRTEKPEVIKDLLELAEIRTSGFDQPAYVVVWPDKNVPKGEQGVTGPDTTSTASSQVDTTPQGAETPPASSQTSVLPEGYTDKVREEVEALLSKSGLTLASAQAKSDDELDAVEGIAAGRIKFIRAWGQANPQTT